jgi:hypothetical protein
MFWVKKWPYRQLSFGSFCDYSNEWNFSPNVRFNCRNFFACSSIKLISVDLNRKEKQDFICGINKRDNNIQEKN